MSRHFLWPFITPTSSMEHFTLLPFTLPSRVSAWSSLATFGLYCMFSPGGHLKTFPRSARLIRAGGNQCSLRFLFYSNFLACCRIFLDCPVGNFSQWPFFKFNWFSSFLLPFDVFPCVPLDHSWSDWLRKLIFNIVDVMVRLIISTVDGTRSSSCQWAFVQDWSLLSILIFEQLSWLQVTSWASWNAASMAILFANEYALTMVSLIAAPSGFTSTTDTVNPSEPLNTDPCHFLFRLFVDLFQASHLHGILCSCVAYSLPFTSSGTCTSR